MQCIDTSAQIVDVRIQRPKINLVYPRVEGMKEVGAQIKMNEAIREQVYGLLEEQGFYQDPTKEFTGSYKIRLNDKGLLSLTIDNYAYAKGAAHGLTIEKALTFDLCTGKTIKFRELFDPRTDFREKINTIIKTMFKEKDIPMVAEFESISDSPDFYLTENALVIFFQLYEYTPYAFGFPRFAIPYSAIADEINKNGVLDRLV